MTQKKIEFQGVDNGLTATMERFRAKAKEITSNMLDDARNYSKSGREQLQLLEDQIAGQEKRNALDIEHARLNENKRFNKESISFTKEKDHVKEQYAQDQESKYFPVRSGADKKHKESMAEIKTAQTQSQEKHVEKQQQISNEGKGETIMSGLLKEQIETIKRISKEEIAEDRRNIIRNVRAFKRAQKRGDFTGFTPVDIAKKRYQSELLEETSPTKKGNAAMAAFTGFLGATMVNKIAAGVYAMPSAKTGLEVIKPLASAIGAVAGGVIGSGMDAIAGANIAGTGLGQTNMTVPVMKAFQTASELAAEAYIRHRESADKMEGVIHKIAAVTGGHPTRAGLSELGISDIEAGQMEENIIRTGAYKTKFAEEQLPQFYASKASKGITEGELMKSMRLMRMVGNEELRTTVGRAETGVGLGVFDEHDKIGVQGLFRGINTMTETLSRNKTRVDQNEIAALLLNLNAVGGQFALKDPRQMQNIQTMQQGLTNPSNDFIKAMQFAVAKKTLSERGEEDATFIEVKKMVQQGFGEPEYVKNIIKALESRGGGIAYQQELFAQTFGMQDNYAGVQEVYDKIADGTYTAEDIKSQMETNVLSASEYVKGAEAFVTSLEKQEARIANAYVTSTMKGVNAVSLAFEVEMKRSISSIADYLVGKMGVPGFGETEAPAENVVNNGKGSAVYKEGMVLAEGGGYRYPTEAELKPPKEKSIVQKILEF